MTEKERILNDERIGHTIQMLRVDAKRQRLHPELSIFDFACPVADEKARDFFHAVHEIQEYLSEKAVSVYAAGHMIAGLLGERIWNEYSDMHDSNVEIELFLDGFEDRIKKFRTAIKEYSASEWAKIAKTSEEGEEGEEESQKKQGILA